jgi:peptidoglycan hydrolase CwlO-like protein
MDPALQLIMDQLRAMETKISAGQEEMNDISDKISATQDRISASQTVFNERMTDTPGKQLKGITAMMEQQT